MSDKHFKILSIDGGGMRGIIPAKVLCDLEEQLQKEHGENARLCEYFDLICGTSTGSIIAIGLALGIPAQKILNLYQQHGKEIFSACWFRKITSGALYNRNALKSYLKEAYGDTRINDCRTRICIPTYDLHEGKIHIFKTPHHSELVHDLHIPTVDAALASSSAPIYFLPYSYTYTNIDSTNINSSYHHIDGGVFANNPALIGLTEAITLGFQLPNISMLSLGTGEDLLRQEEIKSRMGYSYWLSLLGKKKLRIYELMASAQSIYINNTILMLHKGIGNNSKEKNFNYVRLQHKLDTPIELDATDKTSLDSMLYIGQSLYKEHATELFPFIQETIIPYK